MCRHNRCILVSLVVAFLAAGMLALPHPSAAQIIYATNFDDPPYVAGLSLVGQDNWVAPDFLSPNAPIISTDQPRQGRQTVRVWGGDLVPSDIVYQAFNGYFDAVGSYRQFVSYDTGGTQLTRVSAHIRLDGPLTPTPFFAAGLNARVLDYSGGLSPGSNGIGELDIWSDGKVYFWDASSQNADGSPAFLISAPVTLGAWHDLALVSNYATRTTTGYVDGVALGTIAFAPEPPDGTPTNVLSRGSLLTYARPDTASQHKADYVAHYNHVSIQSIGK